MVPAQIIRIGRRLVYRLLRYRLSADRLLLIDWHILYWLQC